MDIIMIFQFGKSFVFQYSKQEVTMAISKTNVGENRRKVDFNHPTCQMGSYVHRIDWPIITAYWMWFLSFMPTSKDYAIVTKLFIPPTISRIGVEGRYPGDSPQSVWISGLLAKHRLAHTHNAASRVIYVFLNGSAHLRRVALFSLLHKITDKLSSIFHK